jgi:hypothetical protein
MTEQSFSSRKPALRRRKTKANTGVWISLRLHDFVKSWQPVMEAQGVRVDTTKVVGVTSNITFEATGVRLYLDVKGQDYRFEGYRGSLGMDGFPDEPVVLVDADLDRLLSRLKTEFERRLSRLRTKQNHPLIGETV